MICPPVLHATTTGKTVGKKRQFNFLEIQSSVFLPFTEFFYMFVRFFQLPLHFVLVVAI
jgi:hypothetical protein